MDLKELQDVLRREKSKIIIVENGEPLMVILSYEEYKKQQTPVDNFDNEQVPSLPEESPDPEELTIDDLPL